MTYFLNNDWGKNQYHNFSNETTKQSTTTIRTIVSSLVVALCLALLILSLWDVSQRQRGKLHIVTLDTTQPPFHITSDKFLSFGLDSSLLRDMPNFPIKNEKFTNLARLLSPAYVRIGGTSADCLFFNQSQPEYSKNVKNPVDGSDISNFSITEQDFVALYRFTKNSNLRMVFDLNVLTRSSDNNWDDSNAREIIDFAKSHEMMIDWQMGNEPNSFRHVFDRQVTAVQLAQDYIHLRYLLNASGFEESLIVGPEVNHIGDPDQRGVIYAKQFLENNKKSIDYITWHQYYLNGREATVDDFVNPETFNYLPMQIKSMGDMIQTSGQYIEMWLSETSTAYGGGAPGLSDKYVAGFLWLDKLGYSAASGVAVVVRQSFFNGYYAMVGPDITPNPDWWVSILYKHFVSETVLKLVTANNFGKVRLYAHCTKERALISRVPSITIYGVNLDSLPVTISIQCLLAPATENAKVFLYILTSNDLKSSDIQLNGETLKLKSDGSLPPFKPVIQDLSQPITMPPYSMAFMIIHGIYIRACDY